MQPDYPESVPQPDLSNVNNAAYAPAVKQKAIREMLEQVSQHIVHNDTPSISVALHSAGTWVTQSNGLQPAVSSLL